MILVLGHNDKAVGEIETINSIYGVDGEFLKIVSKDDYVFRELINSNNYLFFSVSKDNCIQFSNIIEYEWVENKDWFGNKLPGKALKVKCSVIDEHFVSENSHFNKIYKSYYRDLKLNSILD